ncbi:protease inhibitor I42 family protein [Omnitrophica bacterium]|nr:protease inhibitor I42 family protein [Candidatus Omnitrophota bacterium]
MKRLVALTAVIAVFSLPAQCFGADQGHYEGSLAPEVYTLREQDEAVKLSKEDSGRTIRLVIGDKINIKVKGRPTAGYFWQEKKLDTSILENVDSVFKPFDQATGSFGTVTYRYKAIGKGETRLRLEEYPPGKDEPSSFIDIRVIVEE